MTFLLISLFALGLAAAIYAGVSYLYYRIAVKIDPSTTFGPMLIPIWSTYLLYRTAIHRPALYLLATFLVPLLGHLVGGKGWADVIGYVMYAHAMARVAEKLGHSYITYFILFLIPVVNLIVFLILAFEAKPPLPATSAGEIAAPAAPTELPPLPPAPPAGPGA
jgi:hypothetical protein